MKFFLPLLLTVFCFGQSKIPGIPSTPLKAKVETKFIGVKPGTVKGEKAPEEAQYKRIEYKPPFLCMLVRAECSTNVSHKELIEKAKQISSPGRATVEIDWGDISSDEVSFYAVVYLEKRITDYDLVAQDGIYQVSNADVNYQKRYQVARLPLTEGKMCADEKTLRVSSLRYAILNLLNRLAVPHLNSN
ncbi:MAG: hypothetical protein CSA81_05665 [Acidobacteria bacterium]|nr:MAG: hypothetical protein CSA81_05665 [Acidobacteriota bacterium]PIE90922.1 MAG: hypothetical protein CR997_03440 [Acidobacteriota bacterium]